MTIKHKVYLLLGSNIPSRSGFLDSARKHIGEEIGAITICSSIYESEPWGFEAEQMFLNQVVQVSTTLSVLDLLKKTQQIESHHGRKRKSAGSYASRTLDIDILFFDETQYDLPTLKVPHEQIQNRRFTLVPLVEIAPELKHPVFGKTCRQLLEECKDQGKVWKFQSQQIHEA